MPKEKKVWIFDLDDTLMWNEYTYSLAFRRFEKFLREELWANRAPYIGRIARLAEDVSDQMRSAINPATGKIYGLAMERYPQSLVETYRHLCDEGWGVFDQEIAEKIFKIGLIFCDVENYQRAGLVPGAEWVLDFLNGKQDPMALVTRGDPRVQNKKIDALGIRSMFFKIEIVPQKTKKLFAKYSNEKQRRVWGASKVISVGNSYLSDIAPALEAGCSAIYIPAITWKGEEHDGEIRPGEKLRILKTIREIVDIYGEL